jgi:hypothetical protein
MTGAPSVDPTAAVACRSDDALQVADLKRRIARLDRLARGLAKEVGLWQGGNDPLLFAERRMYLAAG